MRQLGCVCRRHRMAAASSEHLLFNLRNVDRDVARPGQASQQHDDAADAHRRGVTSRTACTASAESRQRGSACMKSLADIGRPALRRLLSATYVPQAAPSLDDPRSVSRLGRAAWPIPGWLVNMELCRRFRRHRAFSVAAVSTPWVAAWPWAPTASAAARPPPKRRARRQPAGLPNATCSLGYYPEIEGVKKRNRASYILD